MNGYEKAQRLALTGTDAEIVAVLQCLTVSDIPTSAVARLLREGGLLLWTGERYRGAIQTLVETPGVPQQFIDGIDELKSAIFGGSAQTLQTTVPKWAVKTRQIISAIVSLLPGQEGLIDEVYALDGGRPYKALTVEEFAAQRTAAETTATNNTAASLRNGYVSEAHDVALTAIANNPQITRDELQAAWSARLAEVWV